MNELLIKAVNISPQSRSGTIYPALNLELKSSSIVSIVGPESSGKTLWIKTLNGFNALAQGELSLLQYDVRQLSRIDWLNLQKSLSYVSQDMALLSAYSLMDNILLPALYHKLGSRETLTQRANTLLDEIGFDDKDALAALPAFSTPVQHYYIKIVRALIVCPKLLLLDDLYLYVSRSKMPAMHKFLKSRIKDDGVSLVIATNELDQLLDDNCPVIFISLQTVLVFDTKQKLILSDDETVQRYLLDNQLH